MSFQNKNYLVSQSLEIPNIDKSWTIFLDRDGVINERIMGHYITKVEDFKFLTGVIDAIGIFNKLFFKTIIITNQAGVGKRLMSQSDLDDIHDHLQSELKINGAFVDKIYACTDLPSKSTNHRKPNPYMGIRASHDMPGIDLKKSIMVGDTKSDMQFGRRLGALTVLIEHGLEEQNEIEDSLIDYRFPSLFAFASSL